MWHKVSSAILRYRILFLVLIVLLTIFMVHKARFVEMSYEYAPLLPQKDSAFSDYKNFVQTFGEEGNIIVIGFTDSNFFNIDHFVRWKELCFDLAEVKGVENMLSISNTYQMVKNTEKRRFDMFRVFPDTIVAQEQLDSLAQIFKSIPLYRGYLYNDSTHAFLAVLTMNKDQMKTLERESTIKQIKAIGSEFEKKYNTNLHYSGLPYIRVVNTIKIKNEIFLFTGLALAICLLILYLFFRSFKAMFFPALVVLIGVIFALGIMVMFGFHISILTGMIPPLLIVIGIPNSIFMLNKYHNEYRLHGNKIKALKRVIQRIGNAIFLTNLTTACGFATFMITSSAVLREFGIVASISIFCLFALSLLLIPIIFSFLPPPESRHVKHLDRKGISKIIDRLIKISANRRKWVYTIIIAGAIVSIVGITQMRSTGYMVDDIPKHDPIYIDLHFFEGNFDGLMPLEIIVDSRKPNGILQQSTLLRMDQLNERLTGYKELSSSLSILNMVKMAKQAFYNGDENFYSLPTGTERNFIMSYVAGGDDQLSLARSFIDSTKQISRISIRMKDVGTMRMNELYHQFNNEVAEIFPSDSYDIVVTGSSVVFFKGNEYLIIGLFQSLALAVVLISLFMATMFYSLRMVLMSLIPNILPLLFTAGIMGLTGIPIKPSTILVFSIAFGISVDNTIHFLAKYRQELNLTNWNIQKSVRRALRETGVSMIYTSTVLFCGFGIFTLSSFGGTQALGVLVSLTLLIALISNLILLPSLLIGFERLITTKSFHEPMLQIYNEEEDINLEALMIKHNDSEDETID